MEKFRIKYPIGNCQKERREKRYKTKKKRSQKSDKGKVQAPLGFNITIPSTLKRAAALIAPKKNISCTQGTKPPKEDRSTALPVTVTATQLKATKESTNKPKRISKIDSLWWQIKPF